MNTTASKTQVQQISLFESLRSCMFLFADSKSVDMALNPACYGLSISQSKCSTPIMSSDIVICLGSNHQTGRNLTLSFIQDGINVELYIGIVHKADFYLPIISKPESTELLVVSRATCDMETKVSVFNESQVISLRIESQYPLACIRVARKHAWHGIDYSTGLPILDGKPHNGYSGTDRFLWIRDTSLPWIAAPIHFSHAQKAPGMNVALFFHLLTPFSFLMENSVS